MATAPGVSTTVLSIDGTLGFDMIAWAANVSAMGRRAPRIHSISWGSPESSFPVEWMMRVNGELAKLAAQGLTILVASGDDGVGHKGTIFCDHFEPQFPATSPYVTAVGGTTFPSATARETCWKDSGGGFSTVL